MHFRLLDDGRAEPTDGVCESRGQQFIRYQELQELHEERPSSRLRSLARAYAACRGPCRL